MRLVPAAARPSARRLCVQAEGARRYSSGPSWAASQESDSNSVYAECPPSVCRTGPTRVTTDPNDPPRRSNAERVGRAEDMSSDSLSVADSLRTSSKGPRLANVASPLHFMYLRARLEGLEPPTNGFEGRCSIQLSYRRVACLCRRRAGASSNSDLLDAQQGAI